MVEILQSAKSGHLFFYEYWALIDEPMGSDIVMIEKC